MSHGVTSSRLVVAVLLISPTFLALRVSSSTSFDLSSQRVERRPVVELVAAISRQPQPRADELREIASCADRARQLDGDEAVRELSPAPRASTHPDAERCVPSGDRLVVERQMIIDSEPHELSPSAQLGDVDATPASPRGGERRRTSRSSSSQPVELRRTGTEPASVATRAGGPIEASRRACGSVHRPELGTSGTRSARARSRRPRLSLRPVVSSSAVSAIVELSRAVAVPLISSTLSALFSHVARLLAAARDRAACARPARRLAHHCTRSSSTGTGFVLTYQCAGRAPGASSMPSTQSNGKSRRM